MTKDLKHILCIDDESSILEITTLCLETVGLYKVTACQCGNEGIRTAIEVQPDLILIDVMMPDMDGTTALLKLKENHKTESIPVIFMTARVQPDEIDNYKNSGAIGVIAKPFDPMTLSDEIAEIWQSSRRG